MNLPKGIRIKNGKFFISYQVKNNRRFESTDLPANDENMAAAVEYRRERIHAEKYGIEPESVTQEVFKTGTFATVAQEFLDTTEVKPSTRASYKQLLQTYWLPHLQHRQIKAIKLPTLRKIVRDTPWTSRKVMKNAVSAARMVFEFATDDGYRDDNPALKLIVSRRKSASTDPDPYTVEERDTLLAHLKTNNSAEVHAYFMTAFSTGMRTGELLALTWDDYDGKSLSITKARVRGEITTTKTDENRNVLVQDKLATTLNALPSRFRRESIFTNQYGREYRTGYHLNRRFREAHAATGIRHRTGPYPWRHTYASIGLTSGAQPAWLAAQLGHSLQMFDRVYSKWIDNEERDRIELEKLL